MYLEGEERIPKYHQLDACLPFIEEKVPKIKVVLLII
jgi:hypothetical protein